MKRILWLVLGVAAGIAGIGQFHRDRVSPERIAAAGLRSGKWFTADDPRIRYMGRIDFSNPKLPRFWNPGIVVRIRFRGKQCRIVVRDQVAYDKDHNYVVVVVGNNEGIYRMKLKGHSDTLTVWGNGKMGAENPDAEGDHVVTLCKATEGIGWMEVAGVYTETLLAPPALPDRKIECIGNSITCGFGNDTTGIPCGKGEWYDQHNAWMSYAPVAARELEAQWHLTAVSGIGLIHSCCNMTITMPEVYDRMDSRGNQGDWDFSRYQPDVVTVCLGQNDGVQDSATFCGAYVNFIRHLRKVYPKARIVLLTSPMGNAELTAVLRRYLGGVVEAAHRSGDASVSSFFFSKQWTNGCAAHPDIADDREIAKELTGYLKKLMRW
ncbi:MAG TPA: GDSL-type esterase/lipase family protein [Puia sp.]|nr:GDSL-type esterase/lipase family protein [Puia sp.]